MARLIERKELAAVRADFPAWVDVVFTCGCFDLLHIGHTTLLQAAARLGQLLIVGLNSDESVRGLKGQSRPVQPQQERASALLARPEVDFVVIFDELTPVETIGAVRPTHFVKGDDYCGRKLPEAPLLVEIGAEIHFVTRVPDVSTTALLSADHREQHAPKAETTAA